MGITQGWGILLTNETYLADESPRFQRSLHPTSPQGIKGCAFKSSPNSRTPAISLSSMVSFDSSPATLKRSGKHGSL